MNTRRFVLSLTLLCDALLLVSGCASTTPNTPAVSAASVSQARPASLDDSSMAIVFIYRPKAFVGMGLHPTVMLDGQDLANITNGRFFKGHFAPGHYLFQMDDKKSGAELDLKAGEVYYIKVEIVPGFWKGGGKMTLMAKEQGSYEITQLNPLDPNEIVDKRYQPPL